MDRRLIEMKSARVLVVGDLILDQYWYGAARRISPEAPVPIVQITSVEERIGGAANVAANAASLGAETMLVGVLGCDDRGETLLELCRAAGIHCDVVRTKACPTTVKLRVISQHQQLLRVDFEEKASTDSSEAILEAVHRRLGDADVIVVSDYAKGSVTRVQDIIAAAGAAGKPIVVDPKGTDFARYAGATLITPNLQEFEAVAGHCQTDEQIEVKARDLCRDLILQAVLVTRGEAGMTLIPADGDAVHLQAVAREVYDVTGAGDTVSAVTAVAIAAGNELVQAVTIANAAAGLVVGKLGTATVNREEVDEELARRAGLKRGVMDLNGLREEMTNARRRGESVVMTNGCFDIIHAGHVRYLEAAAALGNRLVVAVNDDDSVRQLKGSGRPVNDLASRMTVLSALDAVDWVVPFSDATPRTLIAELLPDVLVKGGDYEIADISGAEEVMAAGGKVLTLDYHKGHSTSELIERLNGESG